MDKAVGNFEKGAEALIFIGEYLGNKTTVKYRVKKPYRHHLFDKLFRYTRTKTEARILSQLFLRNIKVPPPLIVDLVHYTIITQFVPGIKFIDVAEDMDSDELGYYAHILGVETGKIHSLNIYHGDLTLGNVLIDRDKRDLYIIDFGLAGYSTDIEEFAIDIHLLRRSVIASIPEKEGLFMGNFWKGYKKSYTGNYDEVYERVEEIRLRGRYVEERLRKKYMRETYIEKK